MKTAQGHPRAAFQRLAAAGVSCCGRSRDRVRSAGRRCGCRCSPRRSGRTPSSHPLGRSCGDRPAFKGYARAASLDFGATRLVSTHGDEAAPAIDALGIDVRVIVRHARAGQRAEQSTRASANAGTGQSGDEPARSDHRAHARDGQRTDTGEQARAATDDRAKAGTGAGTRVGVGVDGRGGAGRRSGAGGRSDGRRGAGCQAGRRAVDVASDDADVGMRNAVRFQRRDDGLRLGEGVVEVGVGLLAMMRFLSMDSGRGAVRAQSDQDGVLPTLPL